MLNIGSIFPLALTGLALAWLAMHNRSVRNAQA
jgi:hypothetical protein